MFTYRTSVHTVDVFDHVDAEAVSGDGGEHLPGASPPGQVVWRTPGCDGTEQQLEVVLLSQLLRRGHKGAELHQNLVDRTGNQLQLNVQPHKGLVITTQLIYFYYIFSK